MFYPAIFHKAEGGGFWISFPDFPECFSQGENTTQAYEMASDALGLAIISREISGEMIPEASDPSAVELDSGDFLMVIEFDMLAYQRRTNSKAVKKTLSIPEWLNEAAIAAEINFSQVLREALMVKLQIK
ncbi:MAG: type II toxin-antitoxin system HicB family antitoxin [Clostridiales bacterium]|nr:type II toxin-antitoxin system HicB family antitoxin [Clostridiales bacterium]